MTSQTPRAVAEAIRARGRISDEDVRALRRAIWGGGQPVDRAAAETLLALQREVPERAPAWADLYVEALSEFFLDDDSVSDAGAELLAREVVADGVVEDASELRLLLNLAFPPARCPPRPRGLARDALRASVVASAAAFYAKGPRRPGAVDADDVEAIRRLVYAPGGADGVQVGEGEALWLGGGPPGSAGGGDAPARRGL